MSIDREHLKELASRATPGPWIASADYDLSGRQVSDESILIGTPRGLPDDVGSTEQGADAEFIATARTAVPALLDTLDNAEQRLQAVRAVVQEWESAEVRHEVAPIVRAASARIRLALDGGA